MTTFANQADIQATAIDEFGDQRLSVGDGELALFSSAPLDAPLLEVSSAVIVVHGAMRNAGYYYRAIQAASGKSSQRLVVAPQFLTDPDVQFNPERTRLLHWATEDWKGGLGRVSSFAVMDELLQVVCHTCPRLKGVTIVGNSAGGQFVNRYAAVGRGSDLVDVPVRFVVANPSTYLYFDSLRPEPGGGFSANDDPVVDHWRYGFSGDLPAYVDRPPAEYFQQYIRRDVTYLLGEDDSDPDAVLLEVHPAATAQGRVRRERGERYHAYLRSKAGHEVHRLVRITAVGHDASAIFASPQGRACLFGDVSPSSSS